MFFIMVFNCFLVFQVFDIAWVINRKNFTSATKFLFLTGLISLKYFISLEPSIRNKMWQISKSKKLHFDFVCDSTITFVFLTTF